MWSKQPKNIKCPRGDCVHYPCSPDKSPCTECTCNYHSNALSKEFNYQMKGDSTHEIRTGTEN